VEELVVGARIVSPQESEEFFGTDLAGDGVLAVEFGIRNASESKSYLIRPEKCSVLPSSSASADLEVRKDLGADEEWKQGGEAATAAATGALIVFPIPILIGAFAAMPSISANAAREHALRVSQLRAETVSPGETIHGLSYFSTSDIVLESQMIARLILTEPATNEELTVLVPFKLTD
jgi:hypothetical protein